MSVSIALVCEGPSDLRTICPLADRVIIDHCREWIDSDTIEDYRDYRGLEASEPFFRWHDVQQLARQRGKAVIGHFDGFPLHRDGHRTREALFLLTVNNPDLEQAPRAIIMFRDGDREYEKRRQAILHARDTTRIQAPIPVVIGVANRMRESWVLSGFEPTDEEQPLWDEEVRRVGMDFRRRTHELRSTDEGDDRHPKRILRSLTCEDHNRERECMTKPTLAMLRERGEDNGLASFIDELESRLVTAFR